jgi:hypothetical protein
MPGFEIFFIRLRKLLELEVEGGLGSGSLGEQIENFLPPSDPTRLPRRPIEIRA